MIANCCYYLGSKNKHANTNTHTYTHTHTHKHIHTRKHTHILTNTRIYSATTTAITTATTTTTTMTATTTNTITATTTTATDILLLFRYSILLGDVGRDEEPSFLAAITDENIFGGAGHFFDAAEEKAIAAYTEDPDRNSTLSMSTKARICLIVSISLAFFRLLFVVSLSFTFCCSTLFHFFVLSSFYFIFFLSCFFPIFKLLIFFCFTLFFLSFLLVFF
jgi:hypothetical protein